MPITWRKQISTGNDIIDQNHKYLICLFNSIELALSTPEALKYLPVYVDQLFEYTKEHFDREEKIQLKIDYPGYMEHKLQHQDILDHLEKVNDELQQLVNEKDEEATNEALKSQLDKDILKLAREWIIDHLIKTDKKWSPS